MVDLSSSNVTASSITGTVDGPNCTEFSLTKS